MGYKLPDNIKKNIFLVDSNGEKFTYLDFYEEQSEFQKNIDSRVVVLVLSESTSGSVMGLISFLINGQVPLLVESNLNIEFVNNLIKLYEVEYVFTAINERNKFPNFLEIAHLKNFVLLKTDQISNKYPDENLAILLSTSGTIGSPKVVRLSYENVVSNGQSIIKYLGIGSSDRAITTLPLSYSFGFSILNSHVLAGASIVLTNKSIMEREFWDVFTKHSPTSLSGVPFTFEMLHKVKFFAKSSPDSLRTITQAGGKMRNDLIAEVDKFSKKNKIEFYVMYGQTEATARISYLDSNYTTIKMGSIGKAIPGGKLRIEYLEAENAFGLNDAGELIYSGPNVMMGYAQDRLDITKSDELNGELSTGDIAVVDEDGFYYIVGRLKRFLKISGKRINLEEIEIILNREFSDVYCLGTDDSLEIFTCDGPNTETLKRFICSKFSLNPLGVRIHLVSDIPRLGNGKINYKELENQIDKQ